MANNYVQPGEVIDHTPTVDVASGEAVVIGARIGVAQTDTPANTEGAFCVEDVHALPSAGDVIGQGAEVYLTSDGEITTTATDNTKAGYAFMPAAASDAVVHVKING